MKKKEAAFAAVAGTNLIAVPVWAQRADSGGDEGLQVVAAAAEKRSASSQQNSDQIATVRRAHLERYVGTVPSLIPRCFD